MRTLKGQLIVKVQKEDVTEQGIILTQELPKSFKKAIVKFSNPDNNEYKVGDKIYIGFFVGNEVEIEREKFLLIREKDVVATW